MRVGRLTLHRDYEELRQSCGAADENSHYPKEYLENLLRINNSELPPVPELMLESPLSPNLVVTELLILQYFPTFAGDPIGSTP